MFNSSISALILSLLLPIYSQAQEIPPVLNKIEIFGDPKEIDTDIGIGGVKAVINDQSVVLDQFKERGSSCSKLKRKCYKLKLSQSAELSLNQNGQIFKIRNVNLVSMGFDEGYVSEKLAFELLENIISPGLKNTFSELVLNGESKGLYLVVERPVEVLKKRYNSPFVIRRGYNSFSSVEEFNEETSPFSIKQYSEVLNKLAKISKGKPVDASKGNERLEDLRSFMNLDEYMDLIAFHTLLENGDYSDELYFYQVDQAKLDKSDQKVYFSFLPWDFDDLFKKPHYGKYIKFNRDGHPNWVYSTETHLDELIATDPILYKTYLLRLYNLLDKKLTDQAINKAFQAVSVELLPYVALPQVSAQSKLDKAKIELSVEQEIRLIESRRQRVITRRNLILQDIQDSIGPF